MAAYDSNDAAKPFDYEAAAEPFPAQTRKFNRQLTGHRRFVSAAEALRYAIEELPPKLLLGAWLEVEEERLYGAAMRRLYDSVAFPLTRHTAT